MSPFEIWHFVDSALPAGGYAFSQGLEAAYQKKIIADEKEFENYLHSYLRQLSTAEIPYLNSCQSIFEAWDFSPLEELFLDYEATQISSSLSKGNLILGRSWIRLLKHLYKNTWIENLQQYIAQKKIPAYFTPIFGLSLLSIKIELDTIKQLFMWLNLRDQINAAIRLGILGSMSGNLLQKEIYPQLQKYLDISKEMHFKEAYKSAVSIDLCQTSHHELYSKLFQN